MFGRSSKKEWLPGVYLGAMKVTGLFAGFAIAILLARALEPTGYGVYSLTVVSASLLAIVVQFGMPNFLLREVAASLNSERFQYISNLEFLSRKRILAHSAFGSVIAFSFSWFLLDLDSARLTLLALSFFVLTPIISLTSLKVSYLRGLQRPVSAQIPEMVIKPLTLVLLIILFDCYINASALVALCLLFAALLAALVGAQFFVCATKKAYALPRPQADFKGEKGWIKTSLSFAMVAAATQLNQYFDIYALGIFRSATEVGVYRAIYQTSFFVSFGTSIAALLLAPRIADYFSKGNIEKINTIFRQGKVIALLVAIPACGVLVIFGKEILLKLFTEEYQVGYQALVVLSLMNLMNACFGPLALLLNMTGQVRISSRIHISSAIMNLLLNCLLVPAYGVLGASVATMLSYLVLNVFLLAYSHKHLTRNVVSSG